MEKHIGTIHPPERLGTIPTDSQWLLGQGAGVWLSIEKTSANKKYRIQRFALNGKLDCDRIFEIEENGSIFDIGAAYKFAHVSHCAKCRIKQNEIVFVFNYTEI
jgi:hypothetical protein|tara:strand:+ start:7195 stop:7506 length:312 start_codon:yes stop_codon:yes gene_type:complete